MTSYHIIIQQERRTPVVKERRAYLGEYGYKEDANGCTYMVELEPDNFEIVIDEDRSRMAQSIIDQLHIMATRAEIYSGRIKNALANGWEEIALILQEQAAMGIVPDFSDPQYVGVFEWDGKSPYVICHKGDYASRTMEYAGWPSITKEQYDGIDGAAQVMEGRT